MQALLYLSPGNGFSRFDFYGCASRRPQWSVKSSLLIYCSPAPLLYFSLERQIGATRHQLNFLCVPALKSRISSSLKGAALLDPLATDSYAALMTLSTAEVQEWLEKHIPHRIRASFALTRALEKHIGALPHSSLSSRDEKIARRCETDSIWEGRIIAMRWLVELVGLTQDRNGNPIAKTPKFPSDFLIQHLPGGIPISPSSTEATALAKVWKGSTQGTSHPTHNSSHPPVNEQELEDALAVIVDHLDKTIYAPQRKKVVDVSLVPA
jgi:hypothetical protein